MPLNAEGLDLVDWLSLSMGVERAAVTQGLWIGLAMSVLYLLALLTTRWGERHALIKALVFSTMLHVFSTLSWVAVAPSIASSRDDEPAEPQENETLELTILSEEAYDAPQVGSDAFWNDLPTPADSELSRVDHSASDPFAIDQPDREQVEVESTQTAPDLDTLPDSQADRPDAERSEAEMHASVAPTNLAQPDQLPLGPQPNPPTPSIPRAVPNRTPAQLENARIASQNNSVDSPTVSDLNVLPEELQTDPETARPPSESMAKLTSPADTTLTPLAPIESANSPNQRPVVSRAIPEDRRGIETSLPDRTGTARPQETPLVTDAGAIPAMPADVPKAFRDDLERAVAKATAAIPLTNPEQITIPNAVRPIPQPTRSTPDREMEVGTKVTPQPRREVVSSQPRNFDPQAQITRQKTVDDPREFLKKPDRAVAKLDTPGVSTEVPLAPLQPRGADTKPETVRTPLRTRPERMTKLDEPIQRYRRSDTPKLPTPTAPSRAPTLPTSPKPDMPKLARGGDFDPIRRAGLPPLYQFRNAEAREKAVLSYGGTAESEQAVERGLEWLAANQSEAGAWIASDFGGGNVVIGASGLDTRGAPIKDGIPGSRAESGVTALAILAFLGANYTHERGQYQEEVASALRWLIENQQEDGFLGADATHYARMYSHAMATYAMAEAYGMRKSPSQPSPLRLPLQKAVDYILNQQNDRDGGWRYQKGQTSDMSIFGWNLMALKSAELAGIEVPSRSKDLMIKFLNDRSLGENKGLAAYHVQIAGQEAPTPTMTAEALFCKQMLGMLRDNPASEEAVEYLTKHRPARTEYDVYYWYYGTLAMFQYGGVPFQKWYSPLRDMLVVDQREDDEFLGSWDPRGRWGGYGGRVYSTSMSILCLEGTYRFMPLYKSRPEPVPLPLPSE
ncbi:prenyltransferase/squalene oxidase repeat-containing protein [Thalassoroseus pseudoceratinae]|uniref:prenyltransferase/squalene oxidase repeat-containing protein n=1 Tax=Thalassoroseus pseudoceratinae TaxID=2713176 RepID=UPI00141EDED6|nr:prenyltransferase/squalene oxidase repeat-containing protein [Thalassoroseus pseudoceratinae]